MPVAAGLWRGRGLSPAGPGVVVVAARREKPDEQLRRWRRRRPRTTNAGHATTDLLHPRRARDATPGLQQLRGQEHGRLHCCFAAAFLLLLSVGKGKKKGERVGLERESLYGFASRRVGFVGLKFRREKRRGGEKRRLAPLLTGLKEGARYGGNEERGVAEGERGC